MKQRGEDNVSWTPDHDSHILMRCLCERSEVAASGKVEVDAEIIVEVAAV